VDKSDFVRHIYKLANILPKNLKIRKMKTKLLILNLFIIVLFYSCKEPNVSFEVAQPENVKKQNKFSRNIIGTYYNLENKTELIIGENYIFKKMKTEDTLKISELDKNEIIKNDTLYKLNTKEKYKIRKITDSLFTDYVFSDTIFNLKKNNILKKYKGYYFLNKEIEKSGFWEVEKLNLKNGILKINGIETENEIRLLEIITETKRDTLKHFSVKPTKKQFKEFIKKNGFKEGEIYLKK